MDALLSTTIAAIAAQLPKITAKFGEVEKGIHNLPHTGVDFAIPTGTKLRAIGEGVVDSVVNYGDSNVGKGVFVKLDNGVRLLYGHLEQPLVKPGQHIKAGDIIGLSGNTGHSTGPHLHLQAYDPSGRLIDPTNMAEGVFNKAAAFGLPSLGDLNPFKGIGDKLDALNAKLDSIGYWINPVNWVKELWAFLDKAFSSGSLDMPLLAVTIAAIWAIMLGAEKPKKWIFWTWVIFWLLRGVIFVL
jgi:murein DD-endopeptidase MepM/ murein hydrolase activator NlpD